MYKLAVFVSGRGSNLLSILKKIEVGYLNAEVSIIISNNNSSKALEIARKLKIQYYIVSNKANDKSEINYIELLSIFSEFKIDLIVLAGFLKKIPLELIKNYKNKIINIHPALLPSFGGKGMYGINVHTAVFNSSAKVSGATVHFVDEVYDNGKIIAQKAVDISFVNSPEEIAEKVLSVEHLLLPEVIKMFIDNKIVIKEERIFLS